jgi:hypothetical protein
VDPTSIVVAAVSLIGVLAVGVLAPAWLLSRTEKIHREDREADWERQDKVAEKAAKAAEDLATSQKKIADQAAVAAQLLVDAQAETIRRTNEVAAAAAERDSQVALQLSRIDAQAQRIHTLVNSDMTAARQSERDQTIAMTAVLRKVIALAESRGQVPDETDIQALAAAERRVTELDQILADRLAQMRVVEAEAAKPGAIDLDSPAGDYAGEGGA